MARLENIITGMTCYRTFRLSLVISNISVVVCIKGFVAAGSGDPPFVQIHRTNSHYIFHELLDVISIVTELKMADTMPRLLCWGCASEEYAHCGINGNTSHNTFSDSFSYIEEICSLNAQGDADSF